MGDLPSRPVVLKDYMTLKSVQGPFMFHLVLKGGICGMEGGSRRQLSVQAEALHAPRRSRQVPVWN